MSILLLLTTLFLGCASSVPIVSDAPVLSGTASLMLNLIPEMPEIPAFPSGLDWGYENGLYTLGQQDVNVLLDWRDNIYCGLPDEVGLRGYTYDIMTWQKQFQAVLAKIAELGL